MVFALIWTGVGYAVLGVTNGAVVVSLVDALREANSDRTTLGALAVAGLAGFGAIAALQYVLVSSHNNNGRT